MLASQFRVAERVVETAAGFWGGALLVPVRPQREIHKTAKATKSKPRRFRREREVFMADPTNNFLDLDKTC